MDEITQLQNRLRDLANKSFQQNIYTFSNFLSLADQDAFHRIENELRYASPILIGGHENADRCILRFGNEDVLGYTVPAPIVCIHIKPLLAKFADKLTHRDFLGALMNLGIERATLGDIIAGEKQAYLFCQESIAGYICENLDKVKHTSVSCSLVEDMKELITEAPETINVQASSLRVDGIISKVYNLSRNESLELFRTSKVYVNGRLCENNSKSILPGDVINARGYGKFRIAGEPGTTRKGKLVVNIEVFR